MRPTIEWAGDRIIMIDQRKLPLEETYVECRTYEQAAEAIETMVIRGAPAIGVAAAMGAALGALAFASEPIEKFKKKFNAICDEIAAARPTARNLFWALERMKKHLDEVVRSGKRNPARELVREAKRICAEDIAVNREMGRRGAALFSDGDHVLTHCNAGALATAGYGTALGVLRAAVDEGKKLHVYVDETRPVLQGARLTAWEMKKEKIPATLICDNMAGSLMRQGKINKVIVGADRIAANGDAANKIGTYALAVLARAHRIPFYIAAPVSTFDFSIKTGEDIPIEERQADEVTTFRGAQAAPKGMKVYNPAFDVTPARLITAMITERGVLTPPFPAAIARLKRFVP